MSSLSDRKAAHVHLTAVEDVEFRQRSNLLECVTLVHDALPELSLDEIDLRARLFGKQLRAPIVIASMTGGSERSLAINRELARVAEERGYGFGLGSQRAMLEEPATTSTYLVRGEAPTCLLLGNLGLVQAARTPTERIAALLETVGADALCLHLNPAQELVQPEGDRDFRGGLDALRRLTSELHVPVLVKETGCGLSRGVAERLAACDVRHVDVGGAGGTSFVAVETMRLDVGQRGTGELFRDWGVPTAASLLAVRPLRFETVIATGGIRSGLDVARAIALGASAAGLAGPVLRAWQAGGTRAVHDLLDALERQLRMAMLLVGARDLDALRAAPRVLRGELREWVSASGT